MHNQSLGWIALAVLLLFSFSACDDDEDLNLPVIGTITDIAAGSDQFTTLVSALQRVGLDQRLDVPSGRFTVFAPTDAAFSAAGIDLSSLSDGELTDILNYHVLAQQVIRPADIQSGLNSYDTNLESAAGGIQIPLSLNSGGSSFTINDAATSDGNQIEAVNGVIYVIDQVLMPPSIVDRAVLDGRFTTLISALQRVNLDGILDGDGAFTVFAPTDAAFTQAGIDLSSVSDDDLTDLLTYHVLGSVVAAADIADGSFATTLSESGPDDAPLSLLLNVDGGDVRINQQSKVVVPNVVGTNGIVHAIDTVLSQQSIVDFVVKAGGVSSLRDAVVAAGLAPTLASDGPFTVFAPVNAAFTAAADTIATLSPQQISNVLTFHVLSGSNVRAADITDGDVTTVNGQRFNLDLDGDAPTIITQPDSVRTNIISTDIQGTNGVIHLIDRVLLPENL